MTYIRDLLCKAAQDDKEWDYSDVRGTAALVVLEALALIAILIMCRGACACPVGKRQWPPGMALRKYL